MRIPEILPHLNDFLFDLSGWVDVCHRFFGDYRRPALIVCAMILCGGGLHGALPPWAEQDRINAQRDAAPEELVLRVDEAEVVKRRSLGFIGAVVRETHTLKGEIMEVIRSEAGLKAGDPYVLVVDLDVAAINREKRAHERKVRRGWVGPNVYFMHAPVFSKGAPSGAHPYRLQVWARESDSVLLPGAGPHSFGTPELMGQKGQAETSVSAGGKEGEDP